MSDSKTLTFNGITHTYTVEHRNLDDDDPDYLDGWWWCLIDKDDLGQRKVIAYATSANDAELTAWSANTHANAAVGRAEAIRWFANVLPAIEADR